MVNTCVVFGCNFSYSRRGRLGKEHVSMHAFPKAQEQREAWVKAVRRENWAPTKYSGVCSQHFREEDMDLTGQTRRLREGAVPSVFPSYPTYLQKTVITRTPPVRESVGAKPVDQCTSSSLNSEPASTELTPRKRKLVEELMEKDKALMSAKKKIKVLHQKVRRSVKKIQTDKEIIDELLKQKVINETSAEMLKNSLPSDVCCLLEKAAQNVNTQSSKPGVKYDPDLRSFALTLHYLSPKAYDFVRLKFNNALPCTRTIRSWYMKVQCEPGFSQECFKIIETKCKEYRQKGGVPLVALSIDDMCLKEHIEFVNNKIIGYVDLGTEINSDSLPSAKLACVIMCTAVMDSWKIPCGYFFIDSLTGEERSSLVKACIERLHDIGVKVISVSFDGASSNLNMSRCLGADLCDSNNFRTLFPHPSLPSSSVAVLLDACHMIKLVRNCLAEKKIIYSSEGEIKWSYLQALFDLQSAEGLHMANKLSSKHMLWFKNKMRVRLAAQTLSNSVAEALQFCDKELGLKEFSGCDETVKFICIMDKAFDLLNSSSKFGRGFKAPLTAENEPVWQQFIHDTLCYIDCLYVDQDHKLKIVHSNRKVGFLGLKVSLSSVQTLYNLYVKTNQLNYLLTYKLSQDHLELFFGLIRQRGGWNVNPTCSQFKSAFKRLIVRNQLRCKKTGNCLSQDNVSMLFVSSCHETQFVGKQNVSTDVGLFVSDHDYCSGNTPISQFSVATLQFGEYQLQSNPNDHDYCTENATMSLFSENIIQYIAGFVVRKIISTLKCPECVNGIMQADNSYKFLSFKNKGGLVSPSRDVVRVCRMTELAIREMDTNLLRVLNHSIPCQIATQAYELNLFSCLNSHALDLNPFDTHVCSLIKTISEHYLKVRIAHAAKTVNNRKLDHRSVYNRLAIFKHL